MNIPIRFPTTKTLPPETVLALLTGCEKLHSIVIPDEIKRWMNEEAQLKELVKKDVDSKAKT